jgi:hypothetical protein
MRDIPRVDDLSRCGRTAPLGRRLGRGDGESVGKDLQELKPTLERLSPGAADRDFPSHGAPVFDTDRDEHGHIISTAGGRNIAQADDAWR